jgi:hypothetical protein
MARSSKTTATATLELAAEMSAAELEQRARVTLESTRDRLRILGVQLVALGRECDALDSAETEAGQAAADGWGRAHAAPEQVRTARARLMALVGSAGEAGAQASVVAAEHAQQVAEDEAREASAVAASVNADAAEKRKELDATIANAEAEEAELLDLLPALERQAEAARLTRGFELVDAAIERAQLLAKTVALKKQVAETVAAVEQKELDEHRTQTLETLQKNYPEAVTRIKGTALEVPHVAEVETLLAAYCVWLSAIEHAQGRLEALSAGGIPLRTILDSQGLLGALQGSVGFTDAKRHMVATWLGNFRQFNS